MNSSEQKTHSIVVGYLLWIFGFLGAHRFYYGKQLSGTLYLLTMGIFLIGWIIDLFLIPRMNEEADIRYIRGPIDFNLSWILLTFLGVFGIHRMYMGKWITGLIYLCTFGLTGVGVIYDFWTLNDQICLLNGSKD